MAPPKPEEILMLPLQMLGQIAGMTMQIATLPLQAIQSMVGGGAEFSQSTPTATLDKRSIFGG
jgi:hypothetical protein